MSNLSDDDATIAGAILAHGPISISTLHELLPDPYKLPDLLSAVERLVDLGEVEQETYCSPSGKTAILYSVVRQ